MLRTILFVLFLIFFNVSFAQKTISEPEEVSKRVKQTLDSLSKLTDKKIVSYLIEEYSGKKVTTIYYVEDKSLKSMILSTTDIQIPSSVTKRTVNVVSQTIERRVFDNR